MGGILGTPQPGLDGGGYPIPGLDGLGGTPPSTRFGWWRGTPPMRQSSIASTCCAAGGVPLAFTQEDFLVQYKLVKTLVCWKNFLFSWTWIKTRSLLVTQHRHWMTDFLSCSTRTKCYSWSVRAKGDWVPKGPINWLACYKGKEQMLFKRHECLMIVFLFPALSLLQVCCQKRKLQT